MAERLTRERIKTKVALAGGVPAAIQSFGVGFDTLPLDAPWPVAQAIAAIEDCRRHIRTVEKWLEDSCS